MGGYSDIVSIVARRAQTDRTEADTATQATVTALLEQAEPAALENLLNQLPPALQQQPATAQPESRTAKGFLARVAALAGVEQVRASRLACATLAGIDATAAGAALREALTRLGPDYEELLPPPQGLRDAAGFAAVVARRAELSADEQAQAAVRATLETLAHRVTRGQASDLEPYLPPEYRAHLQLPEHHQAEAFGRKEFLERVAAAEGVSTDVAHSHVRGVLVTLREATPEKEINDTIDQLPNEVAALLR